MIFNEMCVVISLVVLQLIVGSFGLSDKKHSNYTAAAVDANKCANLKSQNGVDLDKIMGLWYGNELITHLKSDVAVPETFSDTCIEIYVSGVVSESANNRFKKVYSTYKDFTQPDLQYEKIHLVLIEKDQKWEYTLRYNKTRRGYWKPLNDYEGIHVMKAVHDHLVLTFCRNSSQKHLFSVIFSRQPMNLMAEDAQSVRSLLQRRNLTVDSVQKVCQSDGERILLVFSLKFLTLLIILNICRPQLF